MGFTLKNEIDLGHLLTLITVCGGIIAWAITQYKSRKREIIDYAHGGAIRLLLRILRNSEDNVVSSHKLYELYQSPENKRLRKEYCKINFRFKDYPQFEAALYGIEEEGKIRYDGNDTVVYKQREKIQSDMETTSKMQLNDTDKQNILKTFYDGFENNKIDVWNIREITRIANKINPNAVQRLLREKSTSDNWEIRSRTIKIIDEII